VYRAEDGGWVSLEPVPNEKRQKRADVGFEYEPKFVFNGDHKWSFVAQERPQAGKRWNELDPTFHGEVHKSIVTLAATQANVPAPLRSQLARTFTTIFGNVIDNPDLRFQSYHPRDHFDSGIIEESWATVVARLQRFYEKPLTDSEGANNLCWALHAIADFYAHSTYAHFLKLEKNTLTPYDPISKKPTLRYDYASDAVFSNAQLSHYDTWWKPGTFDRLARWKGRPISGRYSFHGDSQDIIERLTNAPPDSAFPTPAARQIRGRPTPPRRNRGRRGGGFEQAVWESRVPGAVRVALSPGAAAHGVSVEKASANWLRTTPASAARSHAWQEHRLDGCTRNRQRSQYRILATHVGVASSSPALLRSAWR
jgi:hypothetical protein